MVALNSVEWFESVVLISLLYDDKLSDVTQLIQLDRSPGYFVSVHEQSPFDGDLIVRQFVSPSSPFLKELKHVYVQMC